MRVQASLVAALVGSACVRGNMTPTPASTEPPYFRLAIQANTDSTIKLAQFALAAVKGLPESPRIQGPLVIVGSRYSRDRMDGGIKEVTVIVAIDRTVRDSMTRIEVSAWALDMRPERTVMGGGGRLPTLTTTSPTTVSSTQREPYRVSRDDEDWRSVMEVVEAFVDQGARFLPSTPPPKPRQ